MDVMLEQASCTHDLAIGNEMLYEDPTLGHCR